MSSAMGVVLAVIAAVLATASFILFGKPKGQEIQSEVTIERVKPEVPSEVPVVKEDGAAAIEASQPLPPQADASVDPWVDESGAQNSEALTLETVEQPEETFVASGEEPMMVNLDDATQVVEPLEAQSGRVVSSARYGSENVVVEVQSVPFAVIQDPLRPASLELQALSQKILAWGSSGSAEDLKTVMSYGKHPDPLIRRYVAVAIGQVATAGAIGDEVKSAVPVLEALSQDSDTKVQKMAAKSLRVIQGG
jgi:hypothetical protein